VYQSITHKTVLLWIFVVEFKSELICRNRTAAEGNRSTRSAIVLQAKTLPAAVLGRRDILGAAETGSGKTLAFGIPILHTILEERGRSAGRYYRDLCGAALL
jgi:superfamily II DNA/RNA helicase